MELVFADASGCSVVQNSVPELHPSLAVMKPHPSRPAMCADKVLITREFHQRRPRFANPAVELAALRHLTKFLSTDPSVVFCELAAVLVQACDAGSAGIILEERRGSSGALQSVAVAGQLASEQLQWEPRDSPSGSAIDRNHIEVFAKPEEFYPFLRTGLAIEELLVVPWQLSSGRRGALWVALHQRDRRFDPEDLRLVLTLSDFARVALQRSHSEETRRSCETLASAARLANQLAHEVNNPLQALINSLYLIAPQSDGIHVQEARAQADRLVELIRSVLELKRQDGAVLSYQSVKEERAMLQSL